MTATPQGYPVSPHQTPLSVPLQTVLAANHAAREGSGPYAPS